MKPTPTLLIGARVSGDEARFLRALHGDLENTDAVILANFVVGEQQIDFLVVTSTCAALLELKNFPRPVFGDRNGVWRYKDAAGRTVQYPGWNPWQQTLKQKYALSDAMKQYQATHPGVPPAVGKGYFSEFLAYVCIYPAIHGGSQVTEGDHKVAVRSYPDALKAIQDGSKASAWSRSDWLAFARDHLHLTSVTLQQAIDSGAHEALERLESYRERVRIVVGASLAPPVDHPDAAYGTGLISRLSEPHNYCVEGPAGSAKTFHLSHLAVVLASGDSEVPLLVDAKRFRGGDFWNLVRQSIAPFTRAEPRELLEAIRLGGLKPVLILDGLNECSDLHRPELLRGVQAFVVHCDARLVTASQVRQELHADIQCIHMDLPLPTVEEKRTIYAHHANVTPTEHLDSLCAGFVTPYDLTVAGRSHGTGRPPDGRVELYDRYVRRCLPQHTAVATAILRTLASDMGESIMGSMSRDAFQRTAERLLANQGAPLSVVDTLSGCRLIRLTDDSFNFEHELLFNYFRAEDLRRRVGDLEALASELRRPLNRQLVEYILPRYSDPNDLGPLLSSIDDADILDQVLAGECGPRAQGALLSACMRLMEAARDDLPTLAVECLVVDGVRPVFGCIHLESSRVWTQHDGVLCQTIAVNLDNPDLQRSFLELLDLTEWSLRNSVAAAAQKVGVSADAAWDDAVRQYGGVLQHMGAPVVPCSSVLSALRLALMDRKDYPQGFPARAHMISRARSQRVSHFALLSVLEDRVAADNPALLLENVELVQAAWATRAPILRMHALEYLRSMRSATEKAGTGASATVTQLLESFDTDDPWVNTTLLEVMSAYDTLELSLTVEDARAEMRALIAPDALRDPTLAELAAVCSSKPIEVLAGQAYSCLSKIFEDVFQGIYFEAYSELSAAEKPEILLLAAQMRDPGFLADWVLQELLESGDSRALPVFERYAAGVDAESAFPQGAVTTFVLGLQGCARWSASPPLYTYDGSPDHQAWRAYGEILFWSFRGCNDKEHARISELWSLLTGPLCQATGSVLREFAQSMWRWTVQERVALDLEAAYSDQFRLIAEGCLASPARITSVFRGHEMFNGETAKYLIGLLKRVGSESSIDVLARLVDREEFGDEAIDAVRGLRVRQCDGVLGAGSPGVLRQP